MVERYCAARRRRHANGRESNGMPITATYDPVENELVITGTDSGDQIAVTRDTNGFLIVNGGAVAIAGGPPQSGARVMVNAGLGDDTVEVAESDAEGIVNGGEGN